MSQSKGQFERATEYAMLHAARIRDVTKLPQPVRIVAMVHAAQGVIDNGGLTYFFEADFPEKPPYSLFVDAYRTIGAERESAALAEAVALFPFKNPHLHVKKRNKFMDQLEEEEEESTVSPMETFTKILCGNKEVWRRLAAYAEQHAAAFAD